jgi:hypothetical protein
MATFAKTWSHNVNNFIGPQATVEEQYALAFIALHESLKAAGYTVVFSSNGVTADATDNVVTTADVVQGDNTSSARTWILYDPPAGMPDAGSWQLLVEPETVVGVSKNQGVDSYADVLGFDTAAATVSSTPTPNGPDTALSIQVDFELRPWSGVEEWQGMWWHAVWSDEGDFFFFTREAYYVPVDPFPQGIFAIRTDTAARAGTPAGNLQMLMEWSSASSSPVLSPSPDSTACDEDALGNYTSGVSIGGYTTLAQSSPDVEQGQRVVHFPVYLSSSQGTDRRWFGVWTDVRQCNPNYPFGIVEADDADPVRYAHVIKGLMIPWPADAFPVG